MISATGNKGSPSSGGFTPHLCCKRVSHERSDPSRILKTESPKNCIGCSKGAGFTLVEVLISVLILSIGSVVILQAMAQASSAITLSECRREAVLFSAGKMAETELVLRRALDLEETDGGSFRIGDQPFTWTLTCGKAKGPGPRELSLTVAWERGRDSYSHQVQTVLMRPKRQGEDEG